MRISLRSQQSVLPAIASRVGVWWAGEDLESPPAAGDPRAATPSLSVQERSEELAKFVESYESFVELLCDSAQLGLNSGFEARYETARETVLCQYGPIRPFLAAFLPPDDRDAFRFEAGRPSDAFEKLFAAHNLQEFLRHDDGEMIFRIMKTREALQLYGEHLRLLATHVA